MSDDVTRAPHGPADEPAGDRQPRLGDLPGALRGNEGLEGSLPTLHETAETADGEVGEMDQVTGRAPDEQRS